MKESPQRIIDLQFEKYPEKIYEKLWIVAILCILLASYLQQVFDLVFGKNVPIWLSLLSLLVLTASIATDSLSTEKTMVLKKEYDKIGYHFPISEANPFLPNHVNIRQQFFSFPGLVMVIYYFIAFALPAAGFCGALLKFITTLSNMQKYHRVTYELSLLQSNISR